MGKYKWLLLPPALALLLVLGPLREPATAAPAATTAPAVTTAPAATTAAAGGAGSPSVARVVSTTAGVLLLGLVIVLALSRYARRGGVRATAGSLSLRQSLRLSGRHAVHLVQVDDHVLLLGECDGSLTVLDRAAEPEAAVDDEPVEEPREEDGATPRDLVIPRPASRPAATPRQPRARSAKPSDLARFQAALQAARKAAAKA